MRLLILIFLLFGVAFPVQIPKIVWVYWADQISQAPIVIQMCLQKLRKLSEPVGWEVRLIDRSTEKKWVPDYERFQQIIKNQQIYEPSMFRIENYCDLLRMTIMTQYGGVYADIGTILIESFDWVNSAKDNPDVENKFGDYPEALMFYHPKQGAPERVSRVTNGVQQDILVAPGNQIWFIAAIPKARILVQAYQVFVDILLNGQKVLNKICDTLGLERLGEYIFRNRYYSLNVSLQKVRQYKQMELDKIHGTDPKTRQFAVHYYRQWAINSLVGPLYMPIKIYQKPDLEYYKYRLYPELFLLPYEEVKKTFPFKYSMKMNGHHRRDIQKVLRQDYRDRFVRGACQNLYWFEIDRDFFQDNFRITASSFMYQTLIAGSSFQSKYSSFPVYLPEIYCRSLFPPFTMFFGAVFLAMLVIYSIKNAAKDILLKYREQQMKGTMIKDVSPDNECENEAFVQ